MSLETYLQEQITKLNTIQEKVTTNKHLLMNAGIPLHTVSYCNSCKIYKPHELIGAQQTPEEWLIHYNCQKCHSTRSYEVLK